ncbi:MAG: hypothetical protein P8188_05980 [Gemmatimonadota bacterium]
MGEVAHEQDHVQRSGLEPGDHLSKPLERVVDVADADDSPDRLDMGAALLYRGPAGLFPHCVGTIVHLSSTT